jgi:hypothetical protein
MLHHTNRIHVVFPQLAHKLNVTRHAMLALAKHAIQIHTLSHMYQ